ncbi:MAG: 50S ribosomal protein L15 [Acidobacteria bacterium]|nr:50S ribosomal protein L15 [Acidobacteriota bacterium]|tara:strand:- start:1636 stop:2298 length:663 start_codon:yes stop_codon:yes gene_type:complete
MKLHDVRKKSGARQPRKRVGRGRSSGTGKTSGRGHKGAKSRSGYKRKEAFEGGQMPLVRRIPKRGFSNYPFRKVWAEVNLSQLDRFTSGETIDPEMLAKSGLTRGRFDGIVILGRGELEVAVTVRAHRFSKTAAEKIVAAGGKAEVIHLNDPEAETAEITTSEPRAADGEVVEGSENGTAEVVVSSVAEDAEVAAAEATEVVSDEDDTVKASGDDDEATE